MWYTCNKWSDPPNLPHFNFLFHDTTLNLARVHLTKIWNLLPASIRNSPSLRTFRRHLKTHYFQSAYANP